jgi:pimeloyl-ACP methyl ester carboxylesterase
MGRSYQKRTLTGAAFAPLEDMNPICLTLIAVLAAGPAPTTRMFSLAAGEDIHVTMYDGAERPPVVIVPGMLGGAFGFRHVAPRLSERGHRVIIVDMLGAGGSSKPEKGDYSLTAQSKRLEVVLDSLGISNAIVVAQALGGSVSYRLALHRPDLVKSIVGIDAGAAEDAATPGIKKATKLAPLIRLLGAKRIMVGKVKDGLIEVSGDRSWVTQEVIDAYTAPYREDAGRMLKILQRMAGSKETEQLAPNLPKVATPVLLLVGTAEKVLASEKIEVLRVNLPNFTLRRVENAGQFINEEQPDAVFQAVIEQDR